MSLYPLTDNPPEFSGSYQSMIINVSLPPKVVVGGFAYDGTVAAIIVNTSEYTLKSTAFLALILNM